MKKIALLVSILVFTLAFVASGCGGTESSSENLANFKYYSAEQLKQTIENGEPVILVDIQVEEEFNKHHIKGAIQTNAYPVKTEEEKAKIDEVLPTLEESEEPIVIVCPGGKSGAERTYQHLVEKGIDEGRLYILENGQSGWPYDKLLEK